MTDALAIAAAAAAGALLGTAYFAGLWATVRALPTSGHPALLAAISFGVRFLLAATVFVVLARRGGWATVTAALVGFAIARVVIVRRRLRTMPGGTERPS